MSLQRIRLFLRMSVIASTYLLLTGVSLAAQTSGSSQTAPSYVGSAACEACHMQESSEFDKSAHWKTTLNTRGGPSRQGCEGCHGPGSAHLADLTDKTKIFDFTTEAPKSVNARCLECHAGGTEHMNAINSLHAQNEISCTSCHSEHHATTQEFLLVKSQPELCYTCHLAKKSEFEMPFHHRVNEGAIQCTDCHNVHGTALPKQVRMSSTQDAVCFKCHTDKQGPFVYEHAAMKVEGCESCHVTHGGPNPHMLKVSNVNMLCLQCHTASSFSGAPGTPSFHNEATFFQSCTLCHFAIHGSNFDARFFK
jgi:DmsE family decaheme c-type cytochrome